MKKIPFLSFNELHRPIRNELIQAFTEVLDSNWFILGKQLELFEQEYALWSGTDFCVGVSNGLDALILSLKALDIGYGDEVIVPSNTYIASVLAITHVGATPVFVEPREGTGNINPELIRHAITKKTKVILPVHLYGQACEMDVIMTIANEYGLFVIEDNAQAHGAKFKNKLTGTWGHINATSFYPGKNLGALGDGGAITTNDRKLAEKVRSLRNYGSTIKYKNNLQGFNNRLDELQAALLRIKLKSIDTWTQERIKIAKIYTENLKNITNIELFENVKDSTNVYHLYVIKVNNRDSLANYLKDQGIETLIHYPTPPHLQEAYKNLRYKEGDLPISEQLSKTVLSIPLHIGLDLNSQNYIIEKLKNFYHVQE